MKGNEGKLNKPIYKKWWFWLLAIIIVGGIGGALDGNKKEEAAPAKTEAATPAAEKSEPAKPAEEKKEPAVPAKETAKPAAEEKKAATPAKEPAAASAAAAADWKAEIEKIASSDGSTTEKADAAALLKNKVTIGVDEEKAFHEDIIAEYKSGNYLTGLSDEKYALTNIFKASLVEDRSENMPIGDFAFDFWQNSQYVYRGAETPESDSVKSNEEQMEKSLAKMK